MVSIGLLLLVSIPSFQVTPAADPLSRRRPAPLFADQRVEVASRVPAHVAVPGLGVVLIGSPFTTLASGTLDASGTAVYGFAIPNNPQLLGVDVYLQAAVGSPLRLTKRETSRVSGF